MIKEVKNLGSALIRNRLHVGALWLKFEFSLINIASVLDHRGSIFRTISVSTLATAATEGTCDGVRTLLAPFHGLYSQDGYIIAPRASKRAQNLPKMAT